MAQPNILLIMVDQFAADCLSSAGRASVSRTRTRRVRSARRRVLPERLQHLGYRSADFSDYLHWLQENYYPDDPHKPVELAEADEEAKQRDGNKYRFLKGTNWRTEEQHETTWTALESIRFITEHDSSRPFFLFTSFFGPHQPFIAPTTYSCSSMGGQVYASRPNSSTTVSPTRSRCATWPPNPGWPRSLTRCARSSIHGCGRRMIP